MTNTIYENKHLVIISSDVKAGGISKMIGIHALALVRGI